MIHALYCIAVLWVAVNVAAVLTFGCLVYGKDVKNRLRAFPGRCMTVIDRAFDKIVDAALGKGENS